MTPLKGPTHDLFLNVRKAYRLLHDYQQMVIDAVRYISGQLDIKANGGVARFGGDAKAGYRYLHTPSWDWLPMMCWEFHFVKEIGENQYLSLSLFVVSDTGFYEGQKETPSKEDVASFAPADHSSTRLAFMLRPGHFENLPFMQNRETMGRFFNEGLLPADLKAKGFVGESHDMSCLSDEASADIIVARILKLAKKHSMPLERALHPGQS